MKSKRGGYRPGAGRKPLSSSRKRLSRKVYFTMTQQQDIEKYGHGKSFSAKVNDLVNAQIETRSNNRPINIKFIDLFAGLGGIRIGFESAMHQSGFLTQCVLTSEIKPHAISALCKNFPHENLAGDITKIQSNSIPDFDILLAGFPCQAFSSAGKGHGFLDTRGTLFFEIERILKEKKPYGFILENVEGLVLHDRKSKTEQIGNTLSVILSSLTSLGYKVSWKVLDSQYFGVAQSRKRVYIVGTLDECVNLDSFEIKTQSLQAILESGLPCIDNDFTNKLLTAFSPKDLYGKSVKDKRGGKNNIHSWDIGIKGAVTETQRNLLNKLLTERRKKHWADKIGIDWMDGMPLTAEQISTFFKHPELETILDGLVEQGYLVFEYPKKKVRTYIDENRFITERIPDETKPKGYNIVVGKLSFEFSRILHPNGVAPTIVAMDVDTLGVIDQGGIRQLSIREGLRLCGFPESYNIDCVSNKQKREAFDLLGNTVIVPVIESISLRLAPVIYAHKLRQ